MIVLNFICRRIDVQQADHHPAGRVRIMDFGLAMVTQDLDSVRKAVGYYGHTVRWIASEILNKQGT